MFLAVRQVTTYIPTNALQLGTIIHKHVVNFLRVSTFSAIFRDLFDKENTTMASYAIQSSNTNIRAVQILKTQYGMYIIISST